MIPNAKVCLYPRDPAEAVRVLAEHGRRALILAGGTTATLKRDPGVDTLVDLTRIGHDAIEREGDTWSVGCNVRLQQLADHAGIRSICDGMLADAAAAVGSKPIRNAVTVGGNLIQLFRWSDPPVALLALGAEVDLLGPEGERRLSVDELLAKHPRQSLKDAEILTRVRLPIVSGRRGAFTKFARTAVDFSVVDAAVCLDGEAGKCLSARVAVGGTRGLPFRATEAEKLLTGKNPTRGRLQKAAEAAREASRALPDVRTGKEYRERMVEVIVRRTLQRAATLLKEQG